MKTNNVHRAADQPVDAALNPDALLLLPTVLAVTGLSRTALYVLRTRGQFPPPVSIRGSQRLRWRAGDVTGWLKAQGARS